MSSRLLAMSSALALVISTAAFAHSAAATDAGLVAAPALEQGISGAAAAPAAHHKKHHHRKGKGKDGQKAPEPAPSTPPAQ